MIKIRRSKIDAFIKLKELKNLRNLHPEMRNSLGWSMEHLDKLLIVRGELATNKDFTLEEYYDTKRYVESFIDEKYEDLVNFIIDEKT